MQLAEFLSTAIPVGSACDEIYSGFSKVYLVPVGSGFSLYKKPEKIVDFPEFTIEPFAIELEPEASILKVKSNFGPSGKSFSNTFSFNALRNISEWLQTNRYGKFWLILQQGDRWLITGDDSAPYAFTADFDSGKKENEDGNFDVVMNSDQLRPYYIYKLWSFELNATDWSIREPYKGLWVNSGSNAPLRNNDFIQHSGNIYRVQPLEQIFPVGTPGVSPDFILLGGLIGTWDRAESYSVNDFVLHMEKLYRNNTGDNRYTPVDP